MPHRKVATAIQEIATLKESLSPDTVLKNGDPIIDAALSGDTNEIILQVAGQMKEFQEDHIPDIRDGAKAGEKMGKGLMEHV